jgi:hypothetical protein
MIRQRLSHHLAYIGLIFIMMGCGAPATPTIKPATGTFATDLTQAASPDFGLIFIIEPNENNKIAGYMVMCGEGGNLSMPVKEGLLGLDVDIKDNQFTIDNQEIFIQGKFTNATTLEGTIRAKSESCSIPQNAQWTAKCGAPTGLSYLTIHGRGFSDEALTGSCK